MKPERVKILGIYLIAICVLQICLYLVMSFVALNGNLWLFHFEPRIGTIGIIELFSRGAQRIVLTGIFRWLSVVWILALGLLMLFGRPLIKTYIVSEIILALPSSLVFLVLVISGVANLSAARFEMGMTFLGMIFIPILVAVFFTIIPLGWAFWLLLSSWLREKRRFTSEENLNAPNNSFDRSAS
jgi:flagellar basal body-associated protein FliL